MVHSLLTQRINTIPSVALLASVALFASLLVIRVEEAADKEWCALMLSRYDTVRIPPPVAAARRQAPRETTGTKICDVS